jgi:dinuclear metal center YbgI/SA1388 family protein
MTQISTIIDYISTLVEPSKYKNDYGYNCIQVDSGNTVVRTIAGSVDSGLSIIESAASINADLLIVHHGMFWGQTSGLITDTHGEKIRKLITAGCSLYGCHLPLDGNLEIGNAVEILRLLKVTQSFPFGFESGVSLGACGELIDELNIKQIISVLNKIEGYGPEIVFPFGATNIKTVGVCTGSGGFAIEEAKEKNIDLLITGEPKQSQYHQAKELKQSVLYIGHYASETFGVKALLKLLGNTFNVDTHWISEPTNV